jgi:metal-responsive CopG/Arc/MetJ family transcriptional regulator
MTNDVNSGNGEQKATGKVKASRLRPVREGQKCVTLWLDDEFLEKVENAAAEKGWPRSLLIENLLRKEVGMAPLEEPRWGTNIGVLKNIALRQQEAQKRKKK